MTNSKCVDDKSSVVQDILVNDDLEKQKTNAKNKLNTQSTTTNKQDSKKVVGKSSQVKSKLIVVDVSKQRVSFICKLFSCFNQYIIFYLMFRSPEINRKR